MPAKDVTEKILEDYPDVFADIVNVLVLDEKDQIHENELESTKTVSQYKAANVIRGQDRDVSKFWTKKNIHISLLAMENQTDYDPDAPFRVIGYDGASYRDELNHGEERYPVVTFILYYGTTKRWSKNHRSLCDEFQDVPESLKPYVNDYRIHVFEIAWLSEETVAKFKSDFRIVADYFVQVRKNGNYVPSREEMKHVNEVLSLMEAMTNSRSFQNAQNEFRKGEKNKMTMADWFDKKIDEERAQAKEQGIELGKEQGIELGIDFLLKTCVDLGATRDYAVNRIMTDYHLTEEEAKSRVEKYYAVE